MEGGGVMENPASPAGNALARVPLSDTFPAAVPSTPDLLPSSAAIPSPLLKEEPARQSVTKLPIIWT